MGSVSRPSSPRVRLAWLVRPSFPRLALPLYSPCTLGTGTRIIVARPLLPAFLDRLAAKCASITRRIGSPFDVKSMMGPVISARQLGVVEELVEEARSKGAKIVCGGQRMKGLSEVDGVTDLGKG